MSNTAAEIQMALQHVDNLEVIIESLDYTKYLKQSLFKIKYELRRQYAKATCHPDDLVSDT
jgi:hypothetical protein|tara:strand:- start:208 stop:390 length:183 start_codon:yes stop_codon:yes gene_type:complete